MNLRSTRFRDTPIINGKLGQWVPPTFIAGKVTSYTITIETMGRADKISNLIYGASEYDWVILYYNNIIDPLNDLKIGKILKIPNLNTIRWKT